MSEAVATARESPSPVSRRRRALSPPAPWLRATLMLGGVVVVAAGSLAFWLHGGRTVSIDNAYVSGGQARPLYGRLRPDRRRAGA